MESEATLKVLVALSRWMLFPDRKNRNKDLCFRHISDDLGLTSASISVDSRLRSLMNRQKHISNKLLFGAIFAGLNLLCFLGALHGQKVVPHTRINYSHIPAHGSRRSGARAGLVASVDAVVEHAVVIHPSDSQAITALQGGSSLAHGVAAAPVAFTLPVPEESIELLARENVLALGSAPRAPGLGRAPPTA
jgi:hypothetical protein